MEENFHTWKGEKKKKKKSWSGEKTENIPMVEYISHKARSVPPLK